MYVIDRDAFEALVREAVDTLPQGFRERIENVTFAVEDWANPEDLGVTGTSGGGTLLGVCPADAAYVRVQHDDA